MLQNMLIIAARIPPSEIVPVEIILPRIELASHKIASASTEEKSRLPKTSLPFFEKILRYGSVIEDRIFPNFVNFAPGNQVITMAAVQSKA